MKEVASNFIDKVPDFVVEGLGENKESFKGKILIIVEEVYSNIGEGVNSISIQEVMNNRVERMIGIGKRRGGWGQDPSRRQDEGDIQSSDVSGICNYEYEYDPTKDCKDNYGK